MKLFRELTLFAAALLVVCYLGARIINPPPSSLEARVSVLERRVAALEDVK